MCKNRQENRKSRQEIKIYLFFNVLRAKILPKDIGKFRKNIGKFQANKNGYFLSIGKFRAILGKKGGILGKINYHLGKIFLITY